MGLCALDDSTYLSADDLIDTCLEIQQASRSPGPLRLSLILDSCYSGAFLLRALERILHEHRGQLRPDYLFAASMPDEVAWELPVLNHGLATYCQSVRPLALGSMTATAHGSEQATWAIAAGPLGCSYVTAGAQNPVTYDAYELSVGDDSVRVWKDGNRESLRKRDEWESDLRFARDELYERLSVIRKSRSLNGRLSEADVRAWRERRL